MLVFAALADPVRRHIVTILATRERTAGEISDVVREQFSISQPATSRHLRVLREAGLANHRSEGTRHIYSLRRQGVLEAEEWLSQLRALWLLALDDLRDEVARELEQSIDDPDAGRAKP